MAQAPDGLRAAIAEGLAALAGAKPQKFVLVEAEGSGNAYRFSAQFSSSATTTLTQICVEKPRIRGLVPQSLELVALRDAIVLTGSVLMSAHPDIL